MSTISQTTTQARRIPTRKGYSKELSKRMPFLAKLTNIEDLDSIKPTKIAKRKSSPVKSQSCENMSQNNITMTKLKKLVIKPQAVEIITEACEEAPKPTTRCPNYNFPSSYPRLEGREAIKGKTEDDDIISEKSLSIESDSTYGSSEHGI